MSNRRTFIRQSVLATGTLSMGMFPSQLFASGELVRLTVMHTNDMHYHIDPFPATDAEYAGRGGMIRLASLVARVRKDNPNLLLLDGGDMFQGTPYFNYFQGELILKLMSRMGYDAGTLGNHEFDNGLPTIDSALQYALFPIVSSNYDFSDTQLAGKIKTHLIVKKGGIKIGIYGLGIDPGGLVDPKNFGSARYLDPLQTALQTEEWLKKEHKCDLVIALSHLGLEYEHSKISDTTLAPQTRYTDLIVGGHTHSFMNKPLELKNAEDRMVLVNQAGWGTLATGVIEFVFDKRGKGKTFTAVVNNL